tara:strand:+ start:436 stop:759 length:324 start_codon:yes stop_codon:yes gene_type:complete
MLNYKSTEKSVRRFFFIKLSLYIQNWTFQKCPKCKILKKFFQKKGVLLTSDQNVGTYQNLKKYFVTELFLEEKKGLKSSFFYFHILGNGKKRKNENCHQDWAYKKNI